MTDLQIDYFMAVANNLSFTRTSEKLFVSQPAISRQISKLEKELGVKLFTRNNHKTELTEAGKLYYDVFRRHKSDLIHAKAEADRILGRKKDVMRIGFPEEWDVFSIIPPITERFNTEYPDTEVIISCCGVKELTTSLLNGSLDLIVTKNNSVAMFSEFSCTDATGINKVLLFSADHHLADKKGLTLKDFKDEVFIAPREIADNIITEAIASYTRPYGFIPRIRFVTSHESMIACVRNNMGVAIADEWTRAKDAADIRWIPFQARDLISAVRMSNRESEQVLRKENIIIDVIREREEKRTADGIL